MSSNILWKSFNLCFSKFKCFPTITFSPPPPANTDEQDQDKSLSTTTNNPSSLFKNFNSLYNVNYSDDLSTNSKSITFSSTTTTTATAGDFSDDSSDEYSAVPDFTSAFASHRFFFSSPGSSNSIVEQLQPQENHPPAKDSSGAVVGGGVAVQTDSPDPFSDFRKSMVEMIEARDRTVAGDNGEADWEFLNELLLCYLALNPKHTHKFIVSAFADVVVSLLPPTKPPATPAGEFSSENNVPRNTIVKYFNNFNFLF